LARCFTSKQALILGKVVLQQLGVCLNLYYYDLLVLWGKIGFIGFLSTDFVLAGEDAFAVPFVAESEAKSTLLEFSMLIKPTAM